MNLDSSIVLDGPLDAIITEEIEKQMEDLLKDDACLLCGLGPEKHLEELRCVICCQSHTKEDEIVTGCELGCRCCRDCLQKNVVAQT